ncbi:MAG TPA: LptF/LptG family permease [Armatimonadota bacterium]
MKILDRYISVSVAAAFCSGVAMFMVLLCAMSLLKQLIELIAEKGVPFGMALTIFAYKIPGMLVYAFPMAVLLGILLTFSRMSSESEMVAIRAAGISFVRVIIPTLFIAALVSGMTFWISNVFAPYASKKSMELTKAALHEMKIPDPLSYVRLQDGKIGYAITAAQLDVDAGTMQDVTVLYYAKGVPEVFVHADAARWLPAHGRWEFPHGGYVKEVSPNGSGMSATPGSSSPQLMLESYAMQLQESPFDLSTGKKDPADLTSQEIRTYVAHLRHIGDPNHDLGKWATRLIQRYATPFTCLVFALIGAPLGLRHHRTSSAVGLGISLLVIFTYYFISVYLSTFGDSGRLSPTIAAWTPNVLGALLGIGLIINANK